MGDAFSPSNQSTQATQQSSVGVQGATGSGTTVGVGSGNTGTVAGGGIIDLSKLSNSGGTINVQTPDIDAVHAVSDIAAKAIQGGSTDAYNAIVGNTMVAGKAIDFADSALDHNTILSLGAIGAERDTAANATASVSNLATQSVNSAQQLALNALQSVHAQAASDSATAHDSVLAAQQIAGQAAPVSEGSLATDLSGIQAQQTKVIAIAAAAIIGGFLFFRKSA